MADQGTQEKEKTAFMDQLIEGKEINLRLRYNPNTEEGFYTNLRSGLEYILRDVDSLLLRHSTGKAELDLLDLLPEGWQVKAASVKDGLYKAPEQLKGLQFGEFNPKEKTITLGDYQLFDLAPDELGKVPKLVLSDFLAARALAENPGVDLKKDKAKLDQVITTRLAKVVEALGDLTKNPTAIAKEPFNLS